ncbi:hypothetical protein [Teredinibacter turnerae]|uniref:hypothetical protein n=1 Tax=Teredinibacter turnerae TaxID=2426 RepID=UPI000F28DEEB|nr:hypothetical protein [Teredinibacter turnerae]
MEIEYCWRVGKELPMLNEEEWAQLSPLLSDTVRKIKAYRAEHGCDIPTARANCDPRAVAKFEELTGHKNIGYDVMFYLRRSSYGPKCSSCGKLFRTPKAKLCASCGQKLESNA